MRDASEEGGNRTVRIADDEDTSVEGMPSFKTNENDSIGKGGEDGNASRVREIFNKPPRGASEQGTY